MKYLLDSNIVSDFYDKFSAGYLGIYANLSSLKDTDSVCISILTLYELEYGYANASDDKKSILRQKNYRSMSGFQSFVTFAEWFPVIRRIEEVAQRLQRAKKREHKEAQY